LATRPACGAATLAPAAGHVWAHAHDTNIVQSPADGIRAGVNDSLHAQEEHDHAGGH
jgi:hypothetical protein